MTYHRGTLQEFNDWHEQVKILEGLPKVGYVNGVPAPQNQQTTEYSIPIQSPDGLDDYIWDYGDYPIDGQARLDINNFKSWFPIGYTND